MNVTTWPKAWRYCKEGRLYTHEEVKGDGFKLICGPESGGVAIIPHTDTVYIVPQEHWENCKARESVYWKGSQVLINQDIKIENAPDWVINRLTGLVNVGMNYSVVGKCNPDKLSAPENWKTVSVTVEQLAAHIAKGHPWMPGLLAGQRRLQKNVVSADVLSIDIDGGCDISQARNHPFVKAHACLGIESTNSGIVSAKNLDGHDKFRLVFQLAIPCEDWKTIRICNQYLRLRVEIDGKHVADKSCKDASRFFFGAEGRKEFLLNPDAVLPLTFIEDAMEWYETSKKTKSSGFVDGGAVAEALNHIPPYTPGNDTYHMYVGLAAGVVNDLGDIGADLLRQWDAGRGDWGSRTFDEWLDSVVNSETDTPASVGTLFYWAHQYGYHVEIVDRKLSDKHKKFLKDQGIKPVDGLCSVKSVAGIHLPGLLFPYGDTGYFRLRVDWDDVDPDVIEQWSKNGELPEYVSPWRVKEHPYNPFNVESGVITTGELNVLALNQNGIPAIGLAREWGWKDNPNWELTGKWTMLVASNCYRSPVMGHAYGGLAMSVIEPDYEKLLEDHEVKDAVNAVADKYYNSFKFTLLSNELEDGSVNGSASYIKRHGADAIKHIIDKALPLIHFDEKKGISSALTIEPAGDNSKKLPVYAGRELIRVIVAQTLKTTRVHIPGVNDYRYDPSTGVWVPMDKGEFANLAHELSRRNHWNNKSAKLLNECLSELKVVSRVRPGEMDHPRYICFTNGVLDTKSKELLPHHPKYRLTKRLGFAYIPTALCPSWEKFIAETFEGSSFTQKLVQAMFRWVLAPKKNEKFKCEAIFQLQGAPGMGKGTLLDVLMGLLGKDSYAIFDSGSLESKEGRYDYLSKQALINPDYKGHFSSQAIASLNAIASNEPVSLRSLYKNGANARLGAVVVMAFNETPRVSQDSKDGFARRKILIPFKNPPKLKDRGLSETLASELSGIFNWAWLMDESVAIDIIDASRLHEEFTEDRKEALAESNTVYGWLVENVVDGIPDGANLTGLYQCYQKWCAECGIRHPLGRNNFGKELKRAGAKLVLDKQSKQYHYFIPPADKLDVQALLGLSTPQI